MRLQHPSPTPHPMSIKKLGRYDLIRVLGKGAMGLVYEGRDPNLDRRVAIKTIKVENLSDESAAEYEVRFRTEARSAARLQHPNIVSVYDSDRDGEIAFLVMEFIQGDDLKHHLDKGDLYTLEQTQGIMADLLSALDYAHRQNIVHRDIKPANLLIEPGGRVKLADFGVARIQDSGDATRTQGTIVGTLKYMSPEQLQGRPIDARSDLFAAGVVLYQLLTGARPFDGDTDFAVIQQIVGHTPASASSFNSRLPPAIDALVARSLAKSRDERFATAQEFAAALQLACRDASDRTVVPPVSKPGQGNSSTWTATLLAGESLVNTQSGSPTNSGTSAGASIVTQELELVYWKDIKDSEDVEDLQGFLAKFPSGIYADLARRRLKKLGVQSGDPSVFGSLSGTQGPLGISRPEKTVLMPRGQDAPASGAQLTADAQNADAAWRQLQAEAHDDPDATRLGPASLAVDDADALAPVTGAGAAKSQTTTPLADSPNLAVPSPAKPKALVWVIAAIAVLAVAGIGAKFFAASTPTDSAATALPASAAAPPATAGTAAPDQPASAASKDQAPAKAEAPASPVAASPMSAASRAAAAARKPALDKDSKESRDNKDNKEKATRPAPARAASAAAPSQPAERTPPAATTAVSPRQACEDRMLLGFQTCMSEQCAKPAFAHHPICTERRAIEQRREAERLSR